MLNYLFWNLDKKKPKKFFPLFLQKIDLEKTIRCEKSIVKHVIQIIEVLTKSHKKIFEFSGEMWKKNTQKILVVAFFVSPKQTNKKKLLRSERVKKWIYRVDDEECDFNNDISIFFRLLLNNIWSI